ncbi:PHP domain-containing protein [Egibacter rhizosphaerae]|uniref:PHP domain-containing protein n=1 Tax=Egibacter rhizosphaerae TaxID=1670831 RepID=A0A411YIF7_9ACTN|nr:CehA/McbA family metallohydrolase [Egibacter rhizosphaerae]QBI20931.1 PHP domain-containing protein [Egibacter rhizosphaerae]
MGVTVRTGTFTPADRRAQPHRYVTVPVEADAAALSVTLDHDRSAGVLDLGVFDPSGEFRGYSGGARDRFVITEDQATPGYVPGPLPAGEWHVFLRLHRVADGGLPWEVRVSTEPARPDPLPPPPRPGARPQLTRPPAPGGARWTPGDLHAHTLHSDGTQTIDQLAVQARGLGLEFLAVTDHNTVSHHPHLAAAGARADVTLLPGQEVTADTGHANVFGDVGWIDFREPSAVWARLARASGGLFSINHPIAGDCAWREPLPGEVTHVEAWHGLWDGLDPRPLDWWRQVGGVPIGGTDVHDAARGDLPGHPTTWVCTSAEQPDVLSAIAAGHVALSAASSAPLLVRCEERLVAVNAGGTRCVTGEALLAKGPDAPGRGVTDDPADLGPAAGWHVLLDGSGRVRALTP